jgi:pyruvate/2-oxoglutarate/acetoin dehydrogenase E1 component
LEEWIEAEIKAYREFLEKAIENFLRSKGYKVLGFDVEEPTVSLKEPHLYEYRRIRVKVEEYTIPITVATLTYIGDNLIEVKFNEIENAIRQISKALTP